MRKTIGVQAPFEWADCEGVTVAFSRKGAGRPVLCLSATGHGGRDFEAFTRQANEQGFEVVAVDWPGHGSSPDQPKDFSPSSRSYCALLEALIPKLWPNGPRPILLGNSIGAAAALRLAAERPDLVEGLVLCNPGGLAPLNGLAKMYIANKVRFFAKGAAGDRRFAKAFERYYRGILKLRPAFEQRARIVKAGPELAGVLSEAWNSFRSPDADIRALVPKLACKVLFAWAKDDLIVSWRASKKAALTAPRATVCLLPGGHSPFLEAPELFFEAFLEFSHELEARPHG